MGQKTRKPEAEAQEPESAVAPEASVPTGSEAPPVQAFGIQGSDQTAADGTLLSLQDRIARMRQRLDEETQPEREEAERNRVEEQARLQQEEESRKTEEDRKDAEAKDAAHAAGEPKEEFPELGRSPVQPKPPGQGFIAKAWWVRIAPYPRIQIEADTESAAAAEYRHRLHIVRADLVPEVKPVKEEAAKAGKKKKSAAAV